MKGVCMRSGAILTLENQEDFFKHVKAGKTYRYDPNTYLFKDVQRAAGLYGVKIKYNTSPSMEHLVYGDWSFSVVRLLKNLSEQSKVAEGPFLFDVNDLNI